MPWEEEEEVIAPGPGLEPVPVTKLEVGWVMVGCTPEVIAVVVVVVVIPGI